MEIIDYSPCQYSDLQNAWESLEQGKDMTVFQSFQWYKWLNTSYYHEKTKNIFREWHYILCHENGVPIMIAPIQIIKSGTKIHGIGIEKGFYFIGRKGYSDYLNFIYNQFNPQAFHEISNYLIKKYNLHCFIFEKVLQSTVFSAFLSSSYGTVSLKTESCAALVFPDNFEDYNRSLKKSFRQNIRTAVNRQNRDGKCFSHILTFDISPATSKQLLKIRKQRLKEKQVKSITKFTSKAYNKALSVLNLLFSFKYNFFDCFNEKWAFLIKDGDRIIGYYCGIRDIHKQIYYVVFAGVDKEYTWYSPSISHLYQFIKEECEKCSTEIKMIDFTRGAERYKTDIGGKEKFIEDLKLYIQ